MNTPISYFLLDIRPFFTKMPLHLAQNMVFLPLLPTQDHRRPLRPGKKDFYRRDRKESFEVFLCFEEGMGQEGHSFLNETKSPSSSFHSALKGTGVTVFALLGINVDWILCFDTLIQQRRGSITTSITVICFGFLSCFFLAYTHT